MCQKSTAHEQRRSRAESRKRRFGSNRTAPKIWQERDNMLFTRPSQPIDWREHTTGAVHDRNLPTSSLQVQESCENFLWHRVKVRSIMTGLRHDDEQDDDRGHCRASIVSSLNTSWFRLITNNLIQSRDSCMIARWHQCGTMTSQMLARASFSAVCLTVFPFEFRPRTFTIGFYGKKSFISELMILECSFPEGGAVKECGILVWVGQVRFLASRRVDWSNRRDFSLAFSHELFHTSFTPLTLHSFLLSHLLTPILLTPLHSNLTPQTSHSTFTWPSHTILSH